MILSVILKLIFVLFGLIFSYFLVTLIGLLTPIHQSFKASKDGVDLRISTNGMHTDFILPAKNDFFDWTKILEVQHYELPITDTTYLSLGWGDKAVYLDIETWGELTLKMGLATLFLPTPTILHVTAYNSLPTDTIKLKKTTISTTQYLQLCHFILPYFKVDMQQKIQLIPNAGYTPNDNFYHATGKYHAFRTCNNWVNKGLKTIGVRTALWSPLDKGIFYQFEKIKHN